LTFDTPTPRAEVLAGRRTSLPKLQTGGRFTAGKTLTIKLTDDQQKQIKDASGKTVTVLNINVSDTGDLSETDLDRMSGGIMGQRG